MTNIYQLPGFSTVIRAEDGEQINVRPMTAQDEKGLLEFFRRIPESDRFYLKENVTAPEVIARWVGEIDYNRTIPLLALSGDRIVGDGTLHRRRAGARRHIGEVRVVVDPAYRNKGIGRGLLHLLVNLAAKENIGRLTFEIVDGREEPARSAAMLLGFLPRAVLPGYTRDKDGTPHDLVILELDVEQTKRKLPHVF
ncbi:MAG: GNAT family N-acetyltransferase [SAR202 cluster bacterium]|nr:GNAT family N-acetyltransferase [SAR202 cluster bacterium]